jgi:hypothetical protein
VRTSKIRELQGFVAGVERDKAAVVAGLTLPQNNGLVEGKVNKLKRDLADDVGQGQISAVTSACPACCVIHLSQQVQREERFIFHGEVFWSKNLSRSQQKIGTLLLCQESLRMGYS